MANCCNICTGITVIPVKPEHLFPSNRQSMAALPDFLDVRHNRLCFLIRFYKYRRYSTANGR